MSKRSNLSAAASTGVGLVQADRMPPALDPASFKIDGRDVSDLIAYALRLAPLITYFDMKNRPASGPSPWGDFFRRDITFLLANICADDTQTKYAHLRKTETSDLSGIVQGLTEQMSQWYAWAASLSRSREPGTPEAALFTAFTSAATTELRIVDSEELMQPEPLERTEAHVQTRIEGALSTVLPADALSTLQRVKDQIRTLARQLLIERLSNPQGDHAPQNGLYLAFVHLLQKSQVHLNTLTARHLDYYYREILRFDNLPAEPDRTSLLLKIAPNLPSFLVPKGTLFPTGELRDRTRATFATSDETTITHARLDGLTARHAERYANGDVSGFEEIDYTLPKPKEAGRKTLSLGIKVASPVLRLSGGNRKVSLRLTFLTREGIGLVAVFQKLARRTGLQVARETPDAKLAVLLADMISVSLSTTSGASFFPTLVVDLSDAGKNQLGLAFELLPSDPALDLKSPSLDLYLNKTSPYYGYSIFEGLWLSQVAIQTDVFGLPAATAGAGHEVPLGQVPIQPFGTGVAPGSTFAVSHPDIGGKSLSRLALSADWLDLPADLPIYFEPYGFNGQASDFTAKFAVRTHGVWHDLTMDGTPPDAKTTAVPIFCEHTNGAQRAAMTWTFSTDAAKSLLHIDLGTPSLRLTFAAPAFGFGLRSYADAVARITLENTAKMAKWFKSAIKKVEPIPLPGPPIAPKLAHLTFAYTASDNTLDGSVTVTDYSTASVERSSLPLRPFALDIAGKDAVILEISGAEPLEELSFQILHVETARLQHTASDDASSAIPRWFYRASQRWCPLPVANLLSDGTEGFLREGVIRLSLPGDLAVTALHGGARLAVTMSNVLDLMARIRSIAPQAVEVTRVLEPGVPEITPVPAGSITAAATTTPEIIKVTQPEAPTGGRSAENLDLFRIRVSERLRTKNRAITRLDYETLVLQQFPSVGEAKCIQDDLGDLTLVVMPEAGRWSASHLPFVPLVERLRIARWLRRHQAGWKTRISVVNPTFEPVRLRVWLAPRQPVQRDLLHDLKARFSELIAPWLTDPTSPANIGQSSVTTAEAFATLKASDGIEFVTGLSLRQFYPLPAHHGAMHGFKDTARAIEISESQRLTASTSASVLVPDTRQDIEVLSDDRGLGTLMIERDFIAAGPFEEAQWAADSRLLPMLPVAAGIGNMSVGSDFIITDPMDARPPPPRIDRGAAGQSLTSVLSASGHQ
ncbi:MAG: baseplate J/gp47 family protein [Geminicoccaceae bacterium]